MPEHPENQKWAFPHPRNNSALKLRTKEENFHLQRLKIHRKNVWGSPKGAISNSMANGCVLKCSLIVKNCGQSTTVDGRSAQSQIKGIETVLQDLDISLEHVIMVRVDGISRDREEAMKEPKTGELLIILLVFHANN